MRTILMIVIAVLATGCGGPIALVQKADRALYEAVTPGTAESRNLERRIEICKNFRQQRGRPTDDGYCEEREIAKNG